jgi:glutamate/tyrosine decarboxylase-like PLP-dependent enzyme
MHENVLRRAAELAIEHLASLDDAPVYPNEPAPALHAALDVPLPDQGVDAVSVIEDLAFGAAPGLVASPGGRYFGFVTGGAVPASVAADWLTSAWDQNAFSYVSSPAVSVIEEVAARWLLEVLDLPLRCSVAFVTGCQMAHVTALAAARHEVLRKEGWDVPTRGLYGAPPVHVVTGAMRHVTVDRALRLLGMGEESIISVPVDDSARMRLGDLQRTLGGLDGPTIVVAQAGEVNTGSFDPLPEIADQAEAAGAWLHIDGAFGLWARGAPSLRHLTDGVDRADSWAFDAHKWLNVPYDSGVAAVAHPEAHRAAMLGAAAYLTPSADHRDAYDWTPDASRRGRGIAVYAALRSLGRVGVADLVERCCEHARAIASALEETGFEVLNDVVLNQVLVRVGTENETAEVLRRVQDGGETWVGGPVWQGRAAIRISVSGWATTPADVRRAVEAISTARLR